MKKIMGLCFLLLILFALPACADGDFLIDERYVFTGMGRSYIQGYEPSVQNHVMTLCAPVASRAQGKITATLRADDESASPFRAASYTAAFPVGADGVCRVKMELTLDKSRKNGDYPATLTLSGVDAAGVAVTGDIPLLIRIRDGAPGEDLGAPELSNFDAALRVGEDGALTATVTNASKTKEMTGLTLRVADASGDIVPLGVMPMKLGDLRPGESASFRVPLSVRGNAAVSLHTLDITVGYRALNQYQEVKTSYTLPVSQDMRLETGGLQMASTIIRGDLCGLTLPLMNMGKGELRNVMVSLEMPDVTRTQSVLVGAIAPGETKQAKMSFSAGGGTTGEAHGQLTVAYEDAYGNAGSLSLPLSLTVEEPPVLAASAGAAKDAAERETPLLVYLLGGCCGALLLALILQGVLLGRKARKLEEDRL